MNIVSLISKKFCSEEVKNSLWNGGDIHKAEIKFSFTHKNKKYIIKVCYEQSVKSPKSESSNYDFDDIHVESSVWLYNSISSAFKVSGFKEIFPEIEDKVDDYLKARIFELLRDKTNFTQEDLDNSTKNRQGAIKQFRKDFGLEDVI